MQRQIIDGVPYFLDNQNRLYLWDTEAPACHIGSYTDKKIIFTDTVGKLGDRLNAWRSKQFPRLRKPADAKPSKRRGNASSTTNAEEDSDVDV